MAIVGRADELSWLMEALDAARAGRAATRVVFGGPGIGKTTLLDAVAETAGDFRVLRVSGVESEMELAHAGLHRLLGPFLHRLDDLPTPQRDALARVFGLAEGPPPSRFLIGLATLSLLGLAATEGPLLCLVDDAQWLDVVSRDAVAVAGRRLHADRVGLLVGTRDAPEFDTQFAGLPAIHLHGLSSAEATLLVRRAAPDLTDHHLVRRIVDELQGSPMAIVELAGQLTAEELAARAVDPQPLPLPAQLEDHFAARARQLPLDTQTLLLVAAAEPAADVHTVLTALDHLGISNEAARPALDAGLLVLRPRAMFRHPLVRSAIYGSASVEARRRVHEVLADVAGAEAGERRAWHLAAAATGPDEAIAVGLEQAAERARARGGLSTSGLILSRAADLTPDPQKRVERILIAVRHHLLGGAALRAGTLLEESGPLLIAPLAIGRARELRGSIDLALGEAVRALPALIEAARSLRMLDQRRARTSLLRAAAAALVAGRFAPAGAGDLEIALEVRATPPPDVDPSPADLLLDGYAALILDGPDAATPLLQESLRRLVTDVGDDADGDRLMWLGIGCWMAGAVGADGELHALASRLVELARKAGALIELSNGLLYLAMSELLRGDLATVRAHFAERSEMLAVLGVDTDVGRAVVQAWTGDEAGTRQAVASIAAYAEDHQQGWMLLFVEYALAQLEVGLGNYEAAFTAMSKEYANDSFLVVVGYPNMIEAAVRCGQVGVARQAFEMFSHRAAKIATPISLGMRARTAALLADDADAGPLYEQAIELLAQSRADLQLARAHLLYGEWCRRRHRGGEAREQLRIAHRMLADKGVGAFAERARTELAAAGDRAQRPDESNVRDMTPQERRIAELAAEGATNAEIAEKLYLSAHTVDYHLRKIFRKLAVSSRRQLGAALIRPSVA